MANIDAIKQLGIDVEIDDFGTGYASIVSLMSFSGPRASRSTGKFNTRRSWSLRGNERLVRSIIRYRPSQKKKPLGIGIVAEGVERHGSCHRALERMGCEHPPGEGTPLHVR